MQSILDPLRTLSRRRFLSVAAAAAVLPGCRPSESDVLASAARGSDRTPFVEMVGWVDLSNTAATIAFLGRRLDDRERGAVIENRGVFPALQGAQPSLEMRMELKPGSDPKAISISKETLDSVELTFWHFDDPPPVIRLSREDLEKSVFSLNGEMRRGGWVVGTVRGQQIVTSPSSRDSYAYNLNFQLSLV